MSISENQQWISGHLKLQILVTSYMYKSIQYRHDWIFCQGDIFLKRPRGMDEDGKIAFISMKRKEDACGTRAIINLGYVLRVMSVQDTGHRDYLYNTNCIMDSSA